MPLSICAIFRNEAPYLREWIEFHRIVGIERFYLYQNNSDDDWEGVLRPYAQSGIVEVTDWTMSAPAQQAAYQHLIDRRRGYQEWVAFIDCDEFLFSPVHATVTDVLERAEFRDRSAVAVNWMCFGTSGHERRMDAPVIERFTRGAPARHEMNVFFKCIVRMDRARAATASAHQFVTVGPTVNERGEDVSNRDHCRPGHELLRINHYVTKSRQEWMERIAHGRVDMTCPRSADEFDRLQRSDVDDRSVWRLLPELRRRMRAAHEWG